MKMRICPYDNGILLESEGAYSLLHPWPTLGDESLERHLADLKGPKRLPLTQRALEILEIEKHAKKEKKALRPARLPPMHHLLSVGEKLPLGFDTFKLKIGKSVDEEISYLNSLEFSSPFRLRLDANMRFTKNELFSFFSKLPEKLLCCIDFVEDPLKGDVKDWEDFSSRFDLRVAHDFAGAEFRAVAAVWILKPSRENPWALVDKAALQMKRIVVTSALDHRLGQAVAAWEAGRIFERHPLLIDTCGLNPLTDLKGDGFGLDEELGKLSWVNL